LVCRRRRAGDAIGRIKADVRTADGVGGRTGADWSFVVPCAQWQWWWLNGRREAFCSCDLDGFLARRCAVGSWDLGPGLKILHFGLFCKQCLKIDPGQTFSENGTTARCDMDRRRVMGLGVVLADVEPEPRQDRPWSRLTDGKRAPQPTTWPDRAPACATSASVILTPRFWAEPGWGQSVSGGRASAWHQLTPRLISRRDTTQHRGRGT
jgi:hypothetical protein